MCEDNQTEVAGFLLLGFQLHEYKILLFIVFFIALLMILNGNLLIIVLISTNDQLKIPMFFFLKHLAIADLMLTITIVPMMLDIILKDGITISGAACFLQLQCFDVFVLVECSLITIMSYDRYVAICNPMHYNVIMKSSVCLHIVVGTWFVALSVSCDFVLLHWFHFCRGNTIDHFFCDLDPLMELSTSDTTFVQFYEICMSIFVLFVSFSFIIVTYVFIFKTIINMTSATGRRKAFSTCSSHLTTVCTYFGSLMAVYATPSDNRSSSTNKFMSVLYIVANPLMNPIIYSLRNQEIRRSLQKCFRNSRVLQLH